MNPRPEINPLVELLKTRRSAPVLAMQGDGPDNEQLQTLLTIAARVPDHGKLAPWRFLVFRGEARIRAGKVIAERFKEKSPDATQQQIELESKRLSHAPTVIGVISCAKSHAKIPRWEQQLSAGAACMNLVIAANSMGFKTAWLTQWYAYDRDVLDALGIGADEQVAGFIHIGRKESPTDERVRPALDDLVTYF